VNRVFVSKKKIKKKLKNRSDRPSPTFPLTEVVGSRPAKVGWRIGNLNQRLDTHKNK
jgi:hypothetical protein